MKKMKGILSKFKKAMEINTFDNNADSNDDKDLIIAQLRAQLLEKDRLIETLQS